MLVDPLFIYFLTFLHLLPSLFLILYRKDIKHQKRQNKIFDQQTVCKAPICWSKYTTPD